MGNGAGSKATKGKVLEIPLEVKELSKRKKEEYQKKQAEGGVKEVLAMLGLTDTEIKSGEGEDEVRLPLPSRLQYLLLRRLWSGGFSESDKRVVERLYVRMKDLGEGEDEGKDEEDEDHLVVVEEDEEYFELVARGIWILRLKPEEAKALYREKGEGKERDALEDAVPDIIEEMGDNHPNYFTVLYKAVVMPSLKDLGIKLKRATKKNPTEKQTS